VSVERAKERDQRDRSIALNNIGKDQNQQSELVAKLKDDFRRLQTVNNDMMRDVANSLTLDYGRIADAADEINKCATRLKANIAVLATGDTKKDQKPKGSDEDQLKEYLRRLDESVMSFATDMTLVDAKNRGKAAADLSAVLQFSDAVRKIAEKSKKNSQKQ